MGGYKLLIDGDLLSASRVSGVVYFLYFLVMRLQIYIVWKFVRNVLTLSVKVSFLLLAIGLTFNPFGSFTSR